ncbi:MAG: hypothetical protein BAJALOKI3v1_50108 [Promethearchaeota archaeon]|nr:MAG: hypothetical protein BAJALOKI3v1_50108 [Candidatus Lokiarchaeota archaeon]
MPLKNRFSNVSNRYPAIDSMTYCTAILTDKVKYEDIDKLLKYSDIIDHLSLTMYPYDKRFDQNILQDVLNSFNTWSIEWVEDTVNPSEKQMINNSFRHISTNWGAYSSFDDMFSVDQIVKAKRIIKQNPDIYTLYTKGGSKQYKLITRPSVFVQFHGNVNNPLLYKIKCQCSNWKELCVKI